MTNQRIDVNIPVIAKIYCCTTSLAYVLLQFCSSLTMREKRGLLGVQAGLVRGKV
jgi:hypothetical protein